LYLEEIKIKLFKIKNILNKDNFAKVKDILNHILNYKFDKNIEIVKFLIKELEETIKTETLFVHKPVSALSNKTVKRDLSPIISKEKKTTSTLPSFSSSSKSIQSRPRSSVNSVKNTNSSNMYVTNINITNNIKMPPLNKKFKK
jgi:hypothetical protein